MDRGRVEELTEAITMYSDRMEKFERKWSDRMRERIMPGGRNWNLKRSEAETTLDCDNELELEFDIPIRAMKGDSIATAINTASFSKVHSSNSAKSTRHNPVTTRRADRDETSKWESLDNTKMPSKT